MPAQMNFSPRNFGTSIPAALSRTDNYPMKNGTLQTLEMPASLLFQDDFISDYLLFFSRTELSSDALEFLIAFRGTPSTVATPSHWCRLTLPCTHSIVVSA